MTILAIALTMNYISIENAFQTTSCDATRLVLDVGTHSIVSVFDTFHLETPLE
jgi:hypothetical protein